MTQKSLIYYYYVLNQIREREVASLGCDID